MRAKLIEVVKKALGTSIFISWTSIGKEEFGWQGLSLSNGLIMSGLIQDVYVIRENQFMKIALG
ncbi:hypothetical protein TRIP_C60026 [Candidatus Zixiibacteriota bacterium]|nr:hypothetical protein TRIP_C60026 [candidate division Zixibacteria bacterium]